MNLKTFHVGDKENGRNYGFVDSDKAVIISETDFFHFVLDMTDPLNASVELLVGHNRIPVDGKENTYTLEEVFETVTIEKIRADAREIDDLRKWADYFGIKQRVYGNYEMLKKSMLEIGVSTDGMPKWSK